MPYVFVCICVFANANFRDNNYIYQIKELHKDELNHAGVFKSSKFLVKLS